jgi:WhiB family redox-sensing transcriptional regulator
VTDPGWMFGAACRGVTETMFPERGENRVARRAKKICAGCPVAAECLEYALELRPSAGVWAGLNIRQLQSIRAQRGMGPLGRAREHGTQNGYKQHKNRSERPCWACRDAHNRYEEGRRGAA